MPTNNLINTQLMPLLLTEVMGKLQSVFAALTPIGQNLTAEERQRFGSINEQNKLLVNKVLDYRNNQPALSSPDVDWANFASSHASRSGFEQIELICNSILELCSDPRILHDYGLYQNALVDYDYTKYRANSTQGGSAYTTKMEEIKQLFPNPGGNNGSQPTPPPNI